MAEWKFQRENTVPDDLIPKGPIRVRIVSAEKQISKNGNDMLRIIQAKIGRASCRERV